MIFPQIEGNEALKQSLSELEEKNRMPHALIISGGNEADRAQLAVHLSMWAVCSGEQKPCGECKNCLNAQNRAHSDIYYAKGSGKTNIYNKDELVRIIRDASIKPNQAEKKVYILEECDRRFPVISQNTFLKTLEEPPQDALFIMTCESSKPLLETIRSRASEFKLESRLKVDENALSLAKEIAAGIVSSSEMTLLKATFRLSDRAEALAALDLVVLLLRDGLAEYMGATAELDGETAKLLCRKLTKQNYFKLIEITQSAQAKINANVGLKLVSTWLCAEYRRTVWQR